MTNLNKEKEIIERDLKSQINKIFSKSSYNVNEIELLHKMAKLLHTIEKFCDDNPHHNPHNIESSGHLDDIDKKIEMAKESFDMWNKTRNLSYKNMLKDKLMELDYCIKIESAKRLNPEENMKLQHYITEYNKLHQQIT